MNEFLFKMHIKSLGKFFSEISLLHIVEQMNFCSKCTLIAYALFPELVNFAY